VSLPKSKKEKNNQNWGTPADYFPVPLYIAPLEEEDRLNSELLTPEQRIEWLLMMQKLLLEQFKK